MAIGQDRSWHLDKRIPITLIGAMLVQTVAVGIWLGTVTARLNYLESAVANRSDDSSRLAVAESRLGGLENVLQEIKTDIRIHAKGDRYGGAGKRR